MGGSVVRAVHGAMLDTFAIRKSVMGLNCIVVGAGLVL